MMNPRYNKDIIADASIHASLILQCCVWKYLFSNKQKRRIDVGVLYEDHLFHFKKKKS